MSEPEPLHKKMSQFPSVEKPATPAFIEPETKNTKENTKKNTKTISETETTSEKTKEITQAITQAISESETTSEKTKKNTKEITNVIETKEITNAIETEDEQFLMEVTIIQSLRYYIQYFDESPDQVIHYADSILTIFEKIDPNRSVSYCVVFDTIQGFSPLWKIFFYYFLTYFGFPTNNYTNIKKFLQFMIRQINMHKCTHNSPLYYILVCLIEQFDKTDDYQTLRNRILSLKMGILDYNGRESVVKILYNTLSNTTRDDKIREVLQDFYQKDADHIKTMLFFSVVNAIATWKPADPDQDINLVFKEKWKLREIQNNDSYYSMDELFQTPSSVFIDRCYKDYQDYEDYKDHVYFKDYKDHKNHKDHADGENSEYYDDYAGYDNDEDSEYDEDYERSCLQFEGYDDEDYERPVVYFDEYY